MMSKPNLVNSYGFSRERLTRFLTTKFVSKYSVKPVYKPELQAKNTCDVWQLGSTQSGTKFVI